MANSLKILFLELIVTVICIISLDTAFADIYNVDRTDDNNMNAANVCSPVPNDCSLRGAVIRSNIHTGDDVINVPAGTYTLTITSGIGDEFFGDLDVNDPAGNLTINGAGAQNTIIQAGTSAKNGIDRVLQHFHNQLTINDVTIRYGTVNGNGGGINNDATMFINNSSIDQNAANGSYGGGIFNGDARNLTITNSTISNNDVSGDGGGIFNNGGTVILTNVTISGNESDLGPEPNESGGGVYNASPGTINMTNVTIATNVAYNSQGDGIFNSGTVNLINTLIAQNDNQNCAGTGPYYASYSLSSDLSCSFIGSNNITNTNALIYPLDNNGGATQTHGLFIKSLAIDNGTDIGAPSYDQRGFPRIDIPGVNHEGVNITDIGAYEYQQSTAVPTMTHWGMIIFMVFAGLGAFYYLRRQRRAEN